METPSFDFENGKKEMGREGGVYVSLVNRSITGSVEDVTKLCFQQYGDDFQPSKVHSLNVQGNNLTSLDGLADFVNVREVQLASNDVEELVASDFAGLDALEKLDLASNSINTIQAGAFPPLGGLVGLNLSYNAIENDISGLSALSHLEELDLRENLITTVDVLQPLIHCAHLKRLVLQTSKFEQQNPVCKKKGYGRQVLDMLKQLEFLDQMPVSEWQDRIEQQQDVHMPKFEQAAKRFHSRHQEKDTESSSSPQEEFVVDDAQEEEPPPPLPTPSSKVEETMKLKLLKQKKRRKPIIHTRIVKDRTRLSSEQRRFLVEIMDSLLEEQGSMRPLLSPDQVLYDLNFVDNEENVSLDAVSFRYLLEYAGLDLSLEQVELLACPSDDYSFSLDLLAEIISLANYQMRKIAAAKKKKEEKANQMIDVSMVTEEFPRHDQEIQTEMNEDNPTPIPPNQNVPTEMHIITHELSRLRERLERGAHDVFSERIGSIEDQLRNVQRLAAEKAEEKIRTYEEELSRSSLEKSSRYEKQIQDLQQEVEGLKATLREKENALEHEQQGHFQCRQELLLIKEKKGHAEKIYHDLEEKFSRFQEASHMTHKQLSEQATCLAERLAKTQAKIDTYMAQAQDRANEANGLNERLSVVLQETQQLKQTLGFKQEALDRMEREKIEAQSRLNTVNEDQRALVDKLRATIQSLHRKLVEEREACRKHKQREEQFGSDNEKLAKLITEQKRQLTKAMVSIREKDTALQSLSKRRDEEKLLHQQEMDSLKLELETIKRRVRDVDEERVYALRAQAEADKLKEELERLKISQQTERKQVHGLESELKEQVSELESQLKVKEVMLRDQNDTIARLERDKAKSDHAIAELEAALDQQEHQFNETEALYREAQENAEESQQVIDDQDKKIRQLEEKCDRLKGDLDQKVSSLEMVESEVDQFRTVFREMEQKKAQFQNLEQRLEEKENEINQLQEVRTGLTKQIELKQDAMKQLQQEIKTMQEEISRLGESSKTQDVVIEQQTRDLDEMNKENQTLKQELKVLAKALDLERKKGIKNVTRIEQLIQEIRDS